MSKRKINFFFLQTIGLKKILPLTFLFLAFHMNSQTITKTLPTEVTVLTDPKIGKIDLQFKSDEVVGNLIVIITDSAGHTVFLENLNGFKGLYKKTIDLKESGKGKYNLQIIKDEEKINRKINIQ